MYCSWTKDTAIFLYIYPPSRVKSSLHCCFYFVLHRTQHCKHKLIFQHAHFSLLYDSSSRRLSSVEINLFSLLEYIYTSSTRCTPPVVVLILSFCLPFAPLYSRSLVRQALLFVAPHSSLCSASFTTPVLLSLDITLHRSFHATSSKLCFVSSGWDKYWRSFHAKFTFPLHCIYDTHFGNCLLSLRNKANWFHNILCSTGTYVPKQTHFLIVYKLSAALLN